jgi:hypothetical protein
MQRGETKRIWVRQKQKTNEKQLEIDKRRELEKEILRWTDRERQKRKEKEREREREKDKQRKRKKIERKRHKEKERQTEKDIEIEKDKQRERMRQRKTNRERGREGFHLASGITNKCCHKKILFGLVGVGKGGEGSLQSFKNTFYNEWREKQWNGKNTISNPQTVSKTNTKQNVVVEWRIITM